MCFLLFFIFSICALGHLPLPNEWWAHLIVPIHRSGPKTDIKNHRPISLLCILSRLLERLIYDKIIDKLIDIVSLVQFGFVGGGLDYNNGSSLSIIHSLNGIHLDNYYKKAFNSVPHNVLVKCLSSQ